MKLRLLTPLAIILSILHLSGQDIDPRDYIGEDISRYPYHLRNKIERAFLSETGERFTGSQYDPRSPNYAFEKNRRKTTISDLDGTLDSIRDNMYRGGLTPAQRITQSVLSQTPEAFDYSELDKKYPNRQVRPILPTYIQQEIDDENRARKEQEINLKIKEFYYLTFINHLHKCWKFFYTLPILLYIRQV